MCVTSAPSRMSGPMACTTVVYDDTPESTHVTSYQINAENLGKGPNCMLLHVPGRLIELVDGPQRTSTMMLDLTRDLPPLVEIPAFRGGQMYGDSSADTDLAMVRDYGEAFTVVTSTSATLIEEALKEVRPDRRPIVDSNFHALLAWYEHEFGDHHFVLACFSGTVKPTYPITYSYHPHNDDMVVVPGLDAHDGRPPQVGAPIQRNFRVAFSAQRNVAMPHRVSYRDWIARDAWWAPDDVAGFFDNRDGAPNLDYAVPLEVLAGMQPSFDGRELIDVMVA